MRNWLLLLLVTASLFFSCGPPVTAREAAEQLTGTLSWIYDGDTIKVEPHGKIRLIGIDAPESKSSSRDTYYLRRGLTRHQLRHTAKQAKLWLINNFKGERVVLSFDQTRRDKHGRLLCYVMLQDGRLLNRLLLERGLATVYRRFNFSKKAAFLTAEKQAQKSHLGLWQSTH